MDVGTLLCRYLPNIHKVTGPLGRAALLHSPHPTSATRYQPHSPSLRRRLDYDYLQYTPRGVRMHLFCTGMSYTGYTEYTQTYLPDVPTK
jgi:hypothetical protein